MFEDTADVLVMVNTSSWRGVECQNLESAIQDKDKRSIVALRKSITPIGNWYEEWFGDILKRYRDAVSVWKVFEPFTISTYKIQDTYKFGVYEKIRIEGDFCRLEKRHESEVVSFYNGEGDYCLYCGGWNGSEGQYRMGWDCCHCGSN